MSVHHDVLDVLTFCDNPECYNRKAACAFLLDEMEYQGLNAADVLARLNAQVWELVPESEVEEFVEEYDNASVVISDRGLCGLALVAVC